MEEENMEKSAKRLFAVLCLQLAHPHVFADLGSDAFTEPLLAVFAQDDGLDSLPPALSEDIGMDADAATGLRQHWGLATVADCRAVPHMLFRGTQA